jgi:glutamate-ammonia-ligase adenylyltransferase
MKQCPLPLAGLPDVLVNQVCAHWAKFHERCEAHAEWLNKKISDQVFASQLVKVWASSQYAAEFCQRQPKLFFDLVESGDLNCIYQTNDLSQRLLKEIEAVDDEVALAVMLRQFRNKMMLRIIWRDLNRLASLQETTADISALAEASIQAAVNFHHKKLSDELGVPTAQDVAQELFVLGMGKLGAGELNLSSDIDLIFTYADAGKTVGAKRSIDNHEYFIRLGRKVIQALDQMTADGFVFRVDMRLRPYGESGPLVLSFDALEEYYQSQGRDWERYAMIKARVVAGEKQKSEQLMAMLKPFTYRRYVDFTAIESLRSMKAMIVQEVKRRRLHNDVKLGEGGIRELEFIVQSFQLLRGGREVALQERAVVKVLEQLQLRNYLPEQAVTDLKQAYEFLRNTEHAIQAFRDQQTQKLPDDAFPQAALSFAMGFESWDEFYTALMQHRKKVSQVFQTIISSPEDKIKDDSSEAQWTVFWNHEEFELQDEEQLQATGHENAAEIIRRLTQLRGSTLVQRMQSIGRDRFNQFMPLLLQAVVEADQPSATLLRILPLVESVLRRSAYLLLLVESPGALKQLVILCGASPWISTQLARHPALLDELLDSHTLYQVPEKVELRAELQQQMLRLPWDDLEAHMDALRYFKLAHVLRVAASEVAERLPLMKVSDYLSYIAEVILEHVLALAWHNLAEKHGCPKGTELEGSNKHFIIVAYGKLGGLELGHGSDLDLVFIHDAQANSSTDGERPLDSATFFTRLGQRIIHILTAQTAMGALYEVDMRLRPSGDSGLLAGSLKAFNDYQNKEAWTWEHQALVRARVVAGDTQLAVGFEQVRAEVLAKPRDEAELKVDVQQMREKMRDHLLPKGLESTENPVFQLKQGTGGIVDIEFMVQYAVLAWSKQHPALATFTDNIRILEALQQGGLFTPQDADALSDAYKVFRADAHRWSLQQQPGQVPMEQFAPQREAVLAKWQQLMGT